MTLFAGMYSLNSDKPIDQNLVDILKQSIARTEGIIDSYADDRFALIKWDCAAFGALGIVSDEKGITAITGEPYWECTPAENYSRSFDLIKICEELRKRNIKFLDRCHGNYSLCHYEKDSPFLILAIDKLGVRSIYYTIIENTLYFASALRILESIESIPRRFNISAYVERRVYGVPLGNNTKYLDIKLLRDGQYIECDRSAFKSSFYFSWGNIKPTEQSLDSIKLSCYKAFREAVSIRSSRSDNTFAFLSGGLDSRCVVSILNDLGKRVIAFNFSLPGDKDEIYGKQYADQLGIDFFSEHRPVQYGVYQLISEKIDRTDQDLVKQVTYPRLIFSGDGGSVGMGHVYLSDVLLEKYQRNGKDGAIEFFLSRRKLSDRIFRKKARDIMREIPLKSLKSELDELAAVPPGRDFYLFLLRNDQRRHFEQYWEFIDLTRVEFLEPFYDTRLLSLVGSAPIKPFIGHRFYNDWLDFFPPDAKSVPWQSYPGHAPCSIADKDGSASQWDMYQEVQKEKGKENYHKLMDVVFKNDFPYHLINRFVLYAAIFIHKMSLKDVGYIFDMAYDIYLETSKCSKLKI